ncbi:neprilysin-11 [Drosophila montana]|uniref:neprilysin-11 n=1 Tax=Drosophila montana TaxID=40370 RepID=UPI00313E94DE
MVLRSSHAIFMGNVRAMCKLQSLLLPILASIVAGNASQRLPGYLVRHMNASADACVDFYEHACGGWAQAHVADAYSSQLEQLDYVYHERLAALLEQPPSPGQPRFVQLLRDSYAACRALNERYDVGRFVRWLREFSHVDMETEENDWRPLLRLIKSYGLPSLWQYETERKSLSKSLKLTDAELWLLQLQPPWPVLAVEFLDDFQPLNRTRFRQLYHALQPLGVAQGKLWLQVKRLENQLLLCGLRKLFKEVREREHDEELGEMPFPTYWLQLLEVPELLTTIELQSHVRCASVMLAAEPAPLIARYLQLRLMHKLDMLPASTFGRQECAAQSRQLLTHAAVWLLEQQQPPEQRQLTNATMHELFEQLRQRFELRLLDNRNQFRPATQRFLLEKLKRMRLRVGVLPLGSAEQQQQTLEAHYAQLQLNASDYYGNLLAMLGQAERWAAATAAADRAEHVETDNELYLLQSDGFGSYASPFFLPDRNMVILPQSLLGANLYRPHQAELYTHSALGFLLAHELSHGFAPTDVFYNWRGRKATGLQKIRLLINRRFSSNRRCLFRRHDQMADEKFADVNGLGLAYDSFFRATSSNATADNDTPSEGGHTVQQHFFLNFAQFFCQDDPDLEDSSLHGGSRQRVNDAVASSKPFACAFGCEWTQTRSPCQLY